MNEHLVIRVGVWKNDVLDKCQDTCTLGKVLTEDFLN